MTTDGAETIGDEKQDASSASSSAESGQSSQLDPEVEKEVQKRVSNILAKRGDKAKTLEERVNVLETENKTLKEQRLAETAGKYGLTVEQIQQIGVDNPAKLESLANLFGVKPKTAETSTTTAGTTTSPPTKPVPHADSGKTVGGSGSLTAEQVSKMSPQEQHRRQKEIASIPFGSS